jgi:hypothetical protein
VDVDLISGFVHIGTRGSNATWTMERRGSLDEIGGKMDDNG